MSSPALWHSLGSIPSQGWMESEDWYKEMTRSVCNLQRDTELSKQEILSMLIFFRGVAAAHVLRVLTVISTSGRVSIRFRHRRLAEYYAACYLVENWNDAHVSLTAMPWMGPVLNIASAVEGSRCLVLKWLTTKLHACQSEGWRVWRRWLEVAVEAIHFSVPGTAYQDSIERLVVEVVGVLNHDVSRENGAGDDLDAVTRLAGLRAITRLGRLRPLLTSPIRVPDAAVAEGLQGLPFASARSVEWFSPSLEATMSMFYLTGRRPRLRSRFQLILSTVKNPASAFGVSSQPLSRSWRWIIALSILSSELVMLALGFVIAWTIARLALDFSGVEDAVSSTGALRMAPFGCAVVAVLRLQSYLSSRTAALETAGWLWRLPGRILKASAAWRGFGQTWRWVLAWLDAHVKAVLLILAAAALITGVLGLVTTATKRNLQPRATMRLVRTVSRAKHSSRKATEPDPGCKESGAVFLQLLSYEWQLKAHKNPNEVKILLDEAVRVQSKEQCGFDLPNGWIDMDQRIATEVARYFPSELLRIFGSGHVDLDDRDWKAIVTEPEIINVPQSQDIAGLFRVIHARDETLGTLDRLSDIEARVFAGLLKGRGIGVGQFPSTVQCGDSLIGGKDDTLGIQQAACLLNVAIHRRRQLIDYAAKLDSSVGRQYLDLGVYGLSGCVTLFLLVAAWRQVRSRQAKKQIDTETSVNCLSTMLLNSQWDEAIRRTVLNRIKALDAISQDDMDRLEWVVGELLKRSSSTDKLLAIELAEGVRVLALRALATG